MPTKKKTSAKKITSASHVPTTFNDAKNAVLIVSLIINVMVFVFWLILRFTTQYDQQVFDFLFTR
ncbi:MAG: hypothetical protein ABIP50_03795 [Candidatus Saccharimonadales bacterium]